MSKGYLNVSIPDHFRDYYNCAAVGYITDKQTIFYTNRKNVLYKIKVFVH